MNVGVGAATSTLQVSDAGESPARLRAKTCQLDQTMVAQVLDNEVATGD